MNQSLFIPVLIGTKRDQRKSHFAAQLVHEIAGSIDGISSQLVDPNDYEFPGDGNDPEGKDPRYTEIVKKSDAFVIVTPEYNHSFPGSLKRMIDSELRLYIHKPVALAGVSNGAWGGVRAIEALLSPLRTVGLVTTFTDLQFPKVDQLFDESGQLLRDNQAYEERVKKMYTELIWMAKALAWGRQNLPSQYHQEGASIL